MIYLGAGLREEGRRDGGKERRGGEVRRVRRMSGMTTEGEKGVCLSVCRKRELK